MARTKKSVTKQVQENYPEFADEVNGLSIDQLNNKLASLAKGLEESESTKENDEDLERAHSLASELGAPYRDVKKAVNLKTKYVIGLLKDKGAA
jgi:hypothetical protein